MVLHSVMAFFYEIQVVATDRKNGNQLMSFQELSTRERGSKEALVTTKSIKVLNTISVRPYFYSYMVISIFIEKISSVNFIYKACSVTFVPCWYHVFINKKKLLGHRDVTHLIYFRYWMFAWKPSIYIHANLVFN